MKNKSFLLTVAILIIALSSLGQERGTFTDSRDGKLYKTVKIGTQTWMAENLAYEVTNNCWTSGGDKNFPERNGFLYYFETAKKVCPNGWHLPTDAEWAALSVFLGGRTPNAIKYRNKIPVEKMMATDGFAAKLCGYGRRVKSRYYLVENNGTTQSYSNFSLQPNDGYFYYGTTATWWAEKKSNEKRRLMWLSTEGFQKVPSDDATISYVRCLKD